MRDEVSLRLRTVGSKLARWLEAYLEGRRGRRAAWGFLMLGFGAIVANMMTLACGLSNVNDSVGAACALLAGEFASKAFYSAQARAQAEAHHGGRGTAQQQKLPLLLSLLNNFRIGFYFYLVIDAFKLNS